MNLVPLPYLPPPPPFEITALGKLLGSATDQHRSNSLLAPELIGTMALTASSILVQDLYDVQRPNCSPDPTSLFAWILAPTGEGKDFGAKPFLAPIHQFEAALSEQAATQVLEHRSETEIWRVKTGALKAQLAAAYNASSTDGDYAQNLATAERMLAAHLAAEPQSRPAPRILYKSSSSAALTTELCKRWPAGALVDLDAGAFFARTFVADQSFWNDRWGGTPLFSDTVSRGSMFCASPRLSYILAVQPDVLLRVMQRKGAAGFEDSGFAGRPLIAIPQPTAGTRILTGAAKSTDFLDAYARVALDLLAESITRRALNPYSRRVLKFTAPAQRLLINHFNRMQALTASGMQLSMIPGHAAKANENLGRIAAIIHVMDGLEGDIDLETVEMAEWLMNWYTHQALSLHVATSANSRFAAMALYVENCIRDAHLKGHADIADRDVHYLCNLPSSETRKVVMLLVEQRRIFRWKYGRCWYVRALGPLWRSPLGQGLGS